MRPEQAGEVQAFFSERRDPAGGQDPPAAPRAPADQLGLPRARGRAALCIVALTMAGAGGCPPARDLRGRRRPSAGLLERSAGGQPRARSPAGPPSMSVAVGRGQCARSRVSRRDRSASDAHSAERRRPARTLVAPPGRGAQLASRTISDIHFGERRFGRWPRIRPGDGLARCGRAVSGRVRSRRDARGPRVGRAAAGREGRSHRRDRDEEYDVSGSRARRGAGAGCSSYPATTTAGIGQRRRRRGARSARHRADHRRARRRRARAACGRRQLASGRQRTEATSPHCFPRSPTLLSTAPGGAMLATHHPPFRTGVTTIWPPGIIGLDGPRLLRAVSDAHPDTLITGGHTHRNRRRGYRGMPITEVGSPKDYPGSVGGLRRARGRHPSGGAACRRSHRCSPGPNSAPAR